jgi:hypothetical protein
MGKGGSDRQRPFFGILFGRRMKKWKTWPKAI